MKKSILVSLAAVALSGLLVSMSSATTRRTAPTAKSSSTSHPGRCEQYELEDGCETSYPDAHGNQWCECK